VLHKKDKVRMEHWEVILERWIMPT